jgi:predicted patatin/cPLA2 family phospholipase
MPLKNINYSNTIIYKICCKDLSISEVYIGSTTDFRRRKNSHKTSCNDEKNKAYNFNIYQFIRANGGFENWNMIEIERFEAIDGNDARKRERYWVEELKANLNMIIPSRTDKEWRNNNKEKLLEKHKEYYQNNKEKLLEKHKEYRENNKEKIKEYKKEYRENNKEKIKQYYDDNKEKIKEYYDDNKEKLKEYKKEYRENNKEKIKEKITCKCGSCIRKDYITKHKKSIKHQQFIESLKTNV